MKKFLSILVSLSIAMSLSLMLLTNVMAADTEDVTNVVSDVKLKEALNTVLSVSDKTANISKTQVETLSGTLDLKNKSIASVKGLQHLTNKVTNIVLGSETSSATPNTFTDAKYVLNSKAKAVALWGNSQINSLNLGQAPLTGTYTALNLNDTSVDANVFSILPATVTTLRINGTKVNNISSIPSTVTTLEAKNLQLSDSGSATIGDADIVFNPSTEVKLPLSKKVVEVSSIKFDSTTIQGTANAITVPLSSVTTVGIHALSFDFKDAASSESISGRFSKTYIVLAKTDTLSALVDSVKTLKKGDYTPETWAPFETALSVAQGILGPKEDEMWPQQSEVDSALDKLQKAIDGLVKVTEKLKEDLNKLIQIAKPLKSEDYLAETWTPFQTALTNAEAVVANQSATSVEFTKSIDDLTKGLNGLRTSVSNAPAKTESGKDVQMSGVPLVSGTYKSVESATTAILEDPEFNKTYNKDSVTLVSVVDITVLSPDANGENIKLTLDPLPSGKKYILAHYDEVTGKINAIYEGVDNGDGTFTFSGIKSFSPFALMSAELSSTNTGIDSGNANTPNTDSNTGNNNPNTGDATNVYIFIVLALSSYGAFFLCKKNIKKI